MIKQFSLTSIVLTAVLSFSAGMLFTAVLTGTVRVQSAEEIPIPQITWAIKVEDMEEDEFGFVDEAGIAFFDSRWHVRREASVMRHAKLGFQVQLEKNYRKRFSVLLPQEIIRRQAQLSNTVPDHEKSKWYPVNLRGVLY